MTEEAATSATSGPSEVDVVFNVVWTGTTFSYLRWFVASQMVHSDARFRFIANHCPLDQVVEMERFAARHPSRIVDVVVASEDRMIRHGDCLDLVLDRWDDGELFALVDPDICASGPFVSRMLHLLGDAGVLTSGSEIWTDSNVLPEGQLGVSGEYFFDRDGYTFGSPHLALYRRSVIDEARGRWGIGFSTAAVADLSEPARQRLAEIDRPFLIYDTGKLLNMFIQADGSQLVHHELDEATHIGGLAHHLHPSGYTTDESGETVPDWALWPGMAQRHEVTRYTTEVLRALVDGRTPPAAPSGVDKSMAAKLVRVRELLTTMVADSRDVVAP